MAGGLVLTWSDSPGDMAKRTREYKSDLRNAILDLANEWGSGELQSGAQETASWTDRTAQARQGLSTVVIEEGDTIRIVLFHVMEYGIWLEVAMDGRYAIIMPTIDRLGPSLMAAVRALMA